MAKLTEHQQAAYERSISMMKAHGIVSISLGALGALVSLLYGLMIVIGGVAASYDNDYAAIGAGVMGVLVLIFGVLPSLYFILSGITLVRSPAVRIAKGLTITNLVVGALFNWIVLILAIISLTQLDDYERGKHAA